MNGKSPGESKKPSLIEICAELIQSGLFDAQWYLSQNPDVAASGIDPVMHYARTGALEGRQPSPDIKLNFRKECRESGSDNPLYDFIIQRKDYRSDTVPVIFACNEKYAPYMSVTIASLIANASPDRHYSLFIIYNDILPETRQTILSQETRNVRIKFVWVGDQISLIREKAHVSHHISIETYYRILIPKLFPEYDKCIYLDSDTVVHADIANLFDIDIGDNYIGGVEELWGSAGDREYAFAMHPQPVNFYFNAGIILINIKQFIKNNLLDEFLSIMSQGRKFPTWDQDILNIITRNKILPIDIAWNFGWHQNVRGLYSHIDMRRFCHYASRFYSPSIVHYNSEFKPWDYDDGHFSALFWHYARLSPFFDFLRENSSYCTPEALAQMEVVAGKFRTGHAIAKDAPAKVVTGDFRNIDTGSASVIAKDAPGSPIPIVFATNQQYAPFLSVALASLIANAAQNVNYEVYILYNKLDASAIHTLKRQSTPNIDIVPTDISTRVKDLLAIHHCTDHTSAEADFRILIPEILPQFDKALYLDCDIVINDNLCELYGLDLEHSLLGAVNDVTLDLAFVAQMNQIRNKHIGHYFNSGVLLLNCAAFRKSDAIARFFEYASNGISYVCRDQDILNMVCEGRVRYLPLKWNMGWAGIAWEHYRNTAVDLLIKFMEGFQNPAIVHYTGAKKPTDVYDNHFAKMFWRYAALSPYFERLRSICKYDLEPVLRAIKMERQRESA